MSKTLRVVFHELLGEKESFEKRMFALGVLPETVGIILRKAPVILKSGMSAEKARQYAEAVQEAGGRVTIQGYADSEKVGRKNLSPSIPTFDDFTMCPECGMKQPRGKRCERCGHTFTENGVLEETQSHS
jgi:hypothetical protein